MARALLVVLSLATVVMTALWTARWLRTPSAPAGAQWRAESDVLAQRVEHLAIGGEVDAAASVLEVLLQRPGVEQTGFDGRARMALARSYLAAGRRDQALHQVQAIPWADKGPAVAAEVVGLELAVRWRGLFDDHQRLISGAIPPLNSREAEQGGRAGLWLDRWQQYQALATALDRGARMVAAEGGRVEMPASPALIQLARYSRGDGGPTQLASALGKPETWDAALALAVLQLHLSEHEIDAAAAAGEVLWTRHAGSDQAKTGYRELRQWQLRRHQLEKTLKLWAFPALERRLDALASTYGEAETAARSTIAGEGEANQVAMADGVSGIAAKAKPAGASDRTLVAGANVALDIVADNPEPVLLIDDGSDKNWRLALGYDGISLIPQHTEIAAGRPAVFTIASEHRGEHRIALYRLKDRAAWDAMCKSPTRELLPEPAVAEQVLALDDWTTIGAAKSKPVAFDNLGEGFYVATVTARGCPVVVIAGAMVVDPDLHLLAGRDQALAWVVRRANGQGKADETVTGTATLVRSTERAGGAAWQKAEPAWRSGFAEGFTGEATKDYRRPDQDAAFASGLVAGKTAAVADPPLVVDLRGTSDASGLVRLPLPERLRGRAYQLTVRIDRPEVAVERQARFGADADWTSKAVAWADKPLARPGEAVRFKALLRSFNGDAFRLPLGEIAGKLKLGDAVLAEPVLTISDTGTVAGEVLIPPGADDGALRLVLGDGPEHHLARVERLRLPTLRYELSGLDEGLQVRAGETVPLVLHLRDRGGEPLAGIEVACAVDARADGAEVPCEQPAPATSDLAGEVRFTVTTAAGREADYRATLRFVYDHDRYATTHSWRSHTFPFQLDAVVRNRQLRVGGVMQAELRLPAQAEVDLQFTRAGAALGKPIAARGNWPAWTQVAVPVTEDHLGADAVTISAAVLGGSTASRTLAVTIEGRQLPGTGAAVELMPVRNRVETGEILPVALGVTVPGRDLLVIGGARDLVLARIERLDQPARQLDLTVDGNWAPNLYLQATAYLPDRGFVSSERRALDVLPVDRLLKVAVQPSRDDYRPGDEVEAAVLISDWRGHPAANCSLSLGVVNELVYQLAEDPTPDLWTYFHSYHRAWGLVDGSGEALARPAALLWRAVIHRWQPDAGFTAIGRGGGASGMFGSHAGGGRKLTITRPLIQPETDSAIFWVADLRSGGDGRATVHFKLPASAGRFRCTARANDASAAVVVGEVRSVLASREPYACTLTVPDVVAPGDRVQGQVQIANHGDREQVLVLTLPDASTREVVLPAHGRRNLTIPLVIPSGPASDREVVRVGDILGERIRFAIAVTAKQPGERAVTANATVLRRLPGFPTRLALRLIADQHGEVALPLAVPADAAVWLRLRAWPDAAARRASELAEWRGRNGGDHPERAAIAWLFAAPGADRRAHMAELWPKLGDDAAAIVVKQAAVRRGESGANINHLPDGAIGDWLLARGRATGQALPAPHHRGLSRGDFSDRVASAATAIAEGWGEGPGLWSAVRTELLKRADSSAADEDALALAIGCDAARLADDAETGARLAARLGQLPWTDDLVAVLAAELLPERAVVALNQITVDGAAKPVTMPAADFSDWSAVLSSPLRLHSSAGALVQADLIVQQALPALTVGSPTIALWQEIGDGYEPVADGQPLWPGRRLLLVVDHRQADGPMTVTIALPSLLHPDQKVGEALLIEGRDLGYALAAEDVAAIAGELGADHRESALDRFAAALRRLALTSTPRGRRIATEGGDMVGGDRTGHQMRLQLDAHQCRAIALSTTGEGSCRWLGARIADGLGHDGQLPDRWLAVEPGTNDAPAAVGSGHPLADTLITLAKRCDREELRWLLVDGKHATLADWRRALRVLDPASDHDLDELLLNPHAGQPGHWTTAQLRRWLDGEPLLGVGADHLYLLTGDEPPTLATLAALATTSREDRRRAWRALPQPQAAPTVALAPLKAWYERLLALKLIAAGDYRDWCWRQELDAQLLTDCGYQANLDGWVAFVRQQLGLPLRIGAGVDTGQTVTTWVTLADRDNTGQLRRREASPQPRPRGGHLGADGLANQDLVVVTVADGYELRPLLPPAQPAPAGISLDWTDLNAADALTHLNLLLANRGLPAVRFAPALDQDHLNALPPLTLRCDRMSPRAVLEFIGKLLDLQVIHDPQGPVLAP